MLEGGRGKSDRKSKKCSFELCLQIALVFKNQVRKSIVLFFWVRMRVQVYTHTHIWIVSPTLGTPLLFCRVDPLIQELTSQTSGFWRFFDGSKWHTLHEQSIILHKTFKLTHPQNAGHALNSSAFSISEFKRLLPAIVGSPELDLALESLGAPPEHRFFGITSRPRHLCHSAMSDSLDMTHAYPSPAKGCWGAYAWMSSGYEEWLWEFMMRMCCPTSRVQNVRSLHFQWPGDALWWIQTGTKDMCFY